MTKTSSRKPARHRNDRPSPPIVTEGGRQQEQGLRLTQFWIDHAREAAFRIDSNARFVYVNHAACRSLGYSPEELLAMSLHDIDPSFPAEFWAAQWKEIQQRGSFTRESRHRAKDGRLFPVELAADFLNYEGMECLCVLARDLTRCHQTEQALRESQEALRASEFRFRTLAEHSHDVINLFSAEGQVLYTSPSIKRVLGYEPAERIGTIGPDLLHPDDVEASLTFFARVLQVPGSVGQEVCRLRHKDGTYRTVEITGTNLLEEPGFHAMVSVFRDVTAQTQAEQALQRAYDEVEQRVQQRTQELTAANRQLQAENAFRTAVVNRAAEGLCVCHAVDEYPFVRFTVWSDRMTEITGYTLDQINRLGWYQTVYPDEALREAAIARMAAMRVGHDLRGEPWVITRADGEQRTLLISTSVLDTGDGMTHVLAVMQDITERTRIDQALRDSKEKLAGVLNAVTDHVSMVDEEYNLIWTNGAAKPFFGSQVLGKKCFQAYPQRGSPCEPCAAKQAFADGRKHETEINVPTFSGRRSFWCTANVADRHAPGRPKLAVTVLRDITDRKKMEKALRRSERLASVGTLAAGIAHEINNPLGTITLSAEIAKSSAGHRDQNQMLTAALDNIQASAHRCGRIVTSVLQFARDGGTQKSSGDLGEVIRYATDEAAPLAKEKGVTLRIEPGDDLPQLVMASGEMGQVFTNLIVNAVHASGPGSCVTIRWQAAADDVQVFVEDRGCGMNREQLEQIFDPFYTARRHEGGTGLGLSISHRIVREHGGTIDARSTPGAGTTMRVTLPIDGAGSEQTAEE